VGTRLIVDENSQMTLDEEGDEFVLRQTQTDGSVKAVILTPYDVLALAQSAPTCSAAHDVAFATFRAIWRARVLVPYPRTSIDRNLRYQSISQQSEYVNQIVPLSDKMGKWPRERPFQQPDCRNAIGRTRLFDLRYDGNSKS
jgi:hypothetical protein